jgi:hypothetical protein
MLSPRTNERVLRGDRPHNPRGGHWLDLELPKQPRDLPGMLVCSWTYAIKGYGYDPQHPIAQRIGPDMASFVTGLSSDPDYNGNRTTFRTNEQVLACLMCFIIGPLAIIFFKCFEIKGNKRAAIAKQKFYDSIYDFARLHGLRVKISPETSYICFTDGSEEV